MSADKADGAGAGGNSEQVEKGEEPKETPRGDAAVTQPPSVTGAPADGHAERAASGIGNMPAQAPDFVPEEGVELGADQEVVPSSVAVPQPTWTVMVVEDTDDYRNDAVSELEASTVAYGAAPRVIGVKDFKEAQESLVAGTVDVLVLDVRDDATGDDHAGETILESLKLTRFIPVVLYTAYSQVAQHAEEPVVQVVGKDEGTDKLVDAVRRSFDSGLPQALRTLTDHVREVTREYLWDHLSAHWNTLGECSVAEKTQLLVNRLARSLELTSGLSADGGLKGPLGIVLARPSQWHPSRFYLIPPIGSQQETGDILYDAAGDTYWVQLTPGCDLAQKKADRHLVVAAVPLTRLEPFASWRKADAAWQQVAEIEAPPGGFPRDVNTERKRLQAEASSLRGDCKQLLKGSQGRYFHLPRHLTVPDLLLDFQIVESPTPATVESWERVASLSPPWPQLLVSRYTQQVGRLGADDPDVEATLEGLRLT